MGASIAYHLAKAGQRDVVLLEREPFFGQGASGRNAGGIRYQFSTEINIRLSQLSLPLLDAFEEETGQPIDVRHCGYLFLLPLSRRRNHNVRSASSGRADRMAKSYEIRRRRR
jgi:sarcosine oxidase subunit beta